MFYVLIDCENPREISFTLSSIMCPAPGVHDADPRVLVAEDGGVAPADDGAARVGRVLAVHVLSLTRGVATRAPHR